MGLAAETPASIAKIVRSEYKRVLSTFEQAGMTPQCFITFHDHHGVPVALIRELMGLIPMFLSPVDPRPAREQITSKYGMWDDFKGFTRRGVCLSYPQDPVLYPVAATILHDELILIYESGWVLVMAAPDSNAEDCDNMPFSVARLD